MLPFESDYNNGAHPNVLRRLVETNNQNSLTYGFDQWSKSAREKLNLPFGSHTTTNQKFADL